MKYLRLFIAFAAVGALANAQDKPAEPAKEKAAEKAPEPLTDEAKAALHAIDVRMGGVKELFAKIDDPEYKAEVAGQIEDLEKRRDALEKNFDPGLNEALMASVIGRYQIIALWLKPPALPAPPGFKLPPKRGTSSKSSDTSAGAYNNN